MEKTLSLPREWVYILSAEKPLATLHQLMYELTPSDICDILEFMEVDKFYRIEHERIRKQQENANS